MALAAALVVAPALPATAQQARAGGPPSARAAAPVDLTGTWVSVVTEDWRWRMRVPPKGDYASVPLTPAGIKEADAWDPARDAAAGEQCRGYGAAAVMRVPGRVRISWEGDAAMKVETEAGTQTRLFVFGAQSPPAAPAWQGTSAAFWQPAGGGGGRRGGGAPSRGGSLRVVTTNLRPGYLRRNGVPYSGAARVTEYYTRLNQPTGDVWLVITTVVEDPVFLNARWVTSTHFKKLPDGSPWTPTPCE
ncbi:MAG TPA: hypothetical protein VIY56_10720 [Vicinamibacterales bacterium]